MRFVINHLLLQKEASLTRTECSSSLWYEYKYIDGCLTMCSFSKTLIDTSPLWITMLGPGLQYLVCIPCHGVGFKSNLNY